ncbi:MAG: ADP-ribosylglycohydrolase family protein [Methanolinea sp.]|nr:ADP-ribosylglycohydrolase family protein [Methanolinea sp.]
MDFLHAGGALVGLAIGDALGAPFEGCPPPARRVRDFLPGGRICRRPGYYTDDTLQALAVAESLSALRGFLPGDILLRMIRDYVRQPEVYGPTSGAVFSRVMLGEDPGSAAVRVHALHHGSRSNGSVMRGPPLGIFSCGPELESWSLALSRITHADPVAGACSAWINRMVSDLARGVPRERAFFHALHRCREEETIRVMGEFRAFEPFPGLDALEASHAALSLFMECRTFEDTVSRAVSMGGDADTVGALAGALAGACYGLTGIPGRWLAGLHGMERVWEASVRLWAVSRC